MGGENGFEREKSKSLVRLPCPRDESDEAASINDYIALYEDVQADGRFGDLPPLEDLDWSFSINPMTEQFELRIVSESQEALVQINAAFALEELQVEGWWEPWWEDERWFC